MLSLTLLVTLVLLVPSPMPIFGPTPPPTALVILFLVMTLTTLILLTPPTIAPLLTMMTATPLFPSCLVLVSPLLPPPQSPTRPTSPQLNHLVTTPPLSNISLYLLFNETPSFLFHHLSSSSSSLSSPSSTTSPFHFTHSSSSHYQTR